MEDVRRLLESSPGGMRPLPALCVKDPDDWFRAGGLLELRALVLYPAAGLAWGAATIGAAAAGFEPVAYLALGALFLPALLAWHDDALADAQPGERAAWSLSATFVLLAWVVAGALVFGR